MATIITQLLLSSRPPPLSSSSLTPQSTTPALAVPNSPLSVSTSPSSSYSCPLFSSDPLPRNRHFPFTKSKRAMILASATTEKGPATVNKDERVKQVHTTQEFDEALKAAKNRLVVVEYAASQSPSSLKIYPVMVQLSRTCSDVDFILVMGDESEQTRELCRREGIDKVPHFSFYKGMEKIHEEEGIGPDVLRGDVLYYGDHHSLVVQLHNRQDVEELIGKERGEKGRLVVLDVGLKHCGPCVKVYPTVIKLSRSMEDMVVFARMNGDENDSCMEFLKDMDVVEVPTFLFIRDGEICGRYVGSGKGELIGEILRYQGVRIT